MAQAVVRLQALDGGWETVGKDRLQGIAPEGIEASANEWGSDTCRFTLRRDPRAVHADISAFTPCVIEVGGVEVWSGRVWETPTKEGDNAGISVEGRGWQYHLDDDVYARLFVHTRLSDWVDQRSKINANLPLYYAEGQVSLSANGIIAIVFPKTPALPGADIRGGVTLDLGPSATAKRVLVDYAYTSGQPGWLYAMVQGGDTDNASTAAETPFQTVATSMAASGTIAVTFTAARRYVHISGQVQGGGVISSDVGLRITGIRTFGSTAYESGGASIVKASDVVRDALSIAPRLSQSTIRISATSFSIPDLYFSDYKTPREVIEAVNAFHGYRTRVDIDRVLRFDPLPDVPIYEAGAWQGVQFEDASANSGETIYNRCLVQGTGPDGSPLVISRASSGATMVDRRGFTRSIILPVDSALNTAAADQLGDTYLTNHVTTPLKGSAIVDANGFRQFGGGGGVHPSTLLISTRELVRFTDRVDPDDGSLGRDGRIASVNYTHDQEQAQVQIDNERQNFAALLARYGALAGSR